MDQLRDLKAITDKLRRSRPELFSFAYHARHAPLHRLRHASDVIKAFEEAEAEIMAALEKAGG